MPFNLEDLGKLAGLGGIALGVFVLVFREVIRKNIFPNLAQRQAYKLITLIVMLTFAIAAIGIGAWVYVEISTHRQSEEIAVSFPKENPEISIKAHLSLIDHELYEEAYNNLSEEARRRFQFDFFVSAFASQRKPQGAATARKLYGIQTFSQLPDQTKGAFSSVTYLTDFSVGGRYLETLTVVSEHNAWKILFHQITPCVPPACK